MIEFAVMRAADFFWRLVIKVAHWMRLCYFFVVRPPGRGAYVALWCGDRVLLIKNSYRSRYSFPCGGIKPREGIREAALRELREEVGVELADEHLVEARRFLSREEFRNDYSTVFEAHVPREPAVDIDDREVVWAEFLSLAEARQLPLVSIVRQYFAWKLTAH